MRRFPLLYIYRTLIQILAGIFFLGGFLAGLMIADDGGGFFGFVGGFLFFASTAIVLLLVAELIALALACEDHLNTIRYYVSTPDDGSSGPNAYPVTANPSSGSYQYATNTAPQYSTPTANSTPRYPAPTANAKTYFDQGMNAQLENLHEKAINCFNQAEATGENIPPQLYYRRAESYRAIGDNEKADQDMQLYQEKAAKS